MTNTTHTPGPWLISSSGHNCFTIHADEASSIVGYTLPRFKVSKGQAEPVNPSEEDWANANLMAASPRLLSALESACAALQRIGLEHRVAEIHELVEVRAAIAEAKGLAA